jgi:hypothetical protein
MAVCIVAAFAKGWLLVAHRIAERVPSIQSISPAVAVHGYRKYV